MELDEQLREAGERWRAAERAPVADFRRATQRSSRGSREPGQSRGLLAVPILIGAFLLAVGVVALVNSTSSSQKVTVTQPTVPTSTAPPSVLALDPEIVQTGGLAIDGTTVWVTGNAPDEGPATLEHIDTETGKVIGKVVLGDNGPFQIVVGDGAVWVCSQQNEESAHVTKVDPTTMKITAVIETAGDAAVAVTPDAVWVDHGSGNLARLDPETNKVLATIPLPGAPSGYTAHFITAGPLGIFLANSYDGTLLRVDPSTNTAKEIADVGNYAGEIVELDGSLWVNAYSAVVVIDPKSGAVTRRIERSVRDLASDGHLLWASTHGRSVLRIDPMSGDVAPLALPSGMKFAIALVADPETGAVWAADSPAPRLVRLAP
jgi:streptogramin lyase